MTYASKPHHAVLNALSGAAFKWLLVYDNADDPDGLQDYIPAQGGQLLFTSRDPTFSALAMPLHVEVFQRSESIEHLRLRIPSITPEEADGIAERLADLPIAIAAAAAWLNDTGQSVDYYLQLLAAEGPAAVLDGTSDQAITRTWLLSLDRLRERSLAAYRMFQLFSFLAPEIALDLIYSEEMQRRIRQWEPDAADSHHIGWLIQQIDRLALLRVDQRGDDRGGGYVIIHRVVQSVVRQQMTEEEAVEARDEAQLLLAALAPPGEVDDPRTWPRYRLIWPHLEVVGAVHSTRAEVRELVLTRVRYLEVLGGLTAGRERAERAIQVWTDMTHERTDPYTPLVRQTVRMRYHLANILTSEGDYYESRPISQAVLEDQRTYLGLTHPQTLMTAGSLARTLRAQGRYREAHDWDAQTYGSCVEQFGENDPRTLTALGNLATCDRLMGDFRMARERDERSFDLRTMVSGHEHPSTIAAVAAIGRDLRDAGDDQRSVEVLRGAFRTCVETFGAESQLALSMQANLAVSLRATGQAAESLTLLEDAYEQLAASLGPLNPDVLICRLSLALSLLAADNLERAIGELEALSDAFTTSHGSYHLYTLACTADRALAERARGERKTAVELAQRAVEGLTALLTGEHPHTLAALMNFAICLAEDGRLDAALQILRRYEQSAERVLGSEHPGMLRWNANKLLILRASSHPDGRGEMDEVIARMRRHVGNDHPAIQALREQRYLHQAIDPHPF